MERAALCLPATVERIAGAGPQKRAAHEPWQGNQSAAHRCYCGINTPPERGTIISRRQSGCRRPGGLEMSIGLADCRSELLLSAEHQPSGSEIRCCI